MRTLPLFLVFIAACASLSAQETISAVEIIQFARNNGVFVTDGKEPQRVSSRNLGISGRLQSGTAWDGVKVGTGGTRTLEEQRFLEINHLVLLGLPATLDAVPTERVRVERERVRFVAKILGRDISALEQKWTMQDLTAQTKKTRQEMDAELAKMKTELWLMQQQQQQQLQQMRIQGAR